MAYEDDWDIDWTNIDPEETRRVKIGCLEEFMGDNLALMHEAEETGDTEEYESLLTRQKRMSAQYEALTGIHWEW